MNNAAIKLADKSAVTISGLCLLHCLLPPLLAIFTPYLTGLALFEDEALHVWLLVCVTPISLIAIFWGFTKHRRLNTLLFAVSGLALLLVAATVGHDHFGHEGEIAMTVLGSILLVVGHLFNLKHHKAVEVSQS
ncbi:MerC domain-containing protein [Alteromonas sp. BMJM2]|uniref:MerC domain-containing protein n=1 Tax=Alteromonas sp. BMJM2 TaxID=2954241 RepID=UPI0022B57588|nr:MerC domain-containing protein [Alteromonas sp. BMJM2]